MVRRLSPATARVGTAQARNGEAFRGPHVGDRCKNGTIWENRCMAKVLPDRQQSGIDQVVNFFDSDVGRAGGKAPGRRGF
jgi:hypothetical protein